MSLFEPDALSDARSFVRRPRWARGLKKKKNKPANLGG